MNFGFQLLYEEGPCVAVRKPSGVLTQAPPGIDSLEVRIRALFRSRDGDQAGDYLGMPHRLDRPASGVLVVTRTLRATRKLAAQFERRRVRKLYWACVEGRVEPAAGRWTDFVRKIPERPLAEIVAPQHPDAREAILDYRVVRHLDEATWLEIELQTGRMHQVRLQAAARGHAVLGDAMYGSRVLFGEQFADGRLRAIALHARRLEFRHPSTQRTVTIVAEPAAVWRPLVG